MKLSGRNAFLALAALAALSVAVWTWILKPGIPTSSDAAQYVELAENLRKHGVFGFGDPPAPGNDREPGYPALLSVVFVFAGGVSLPSVIIVQAALLAVGAWTLWRLGLKLYPASRLPAIVAALATAVYPILAQYAGLFLSEMLQMVLFLTALDITIEAFAKDDRVKPPIAGVVWAALIMTRLTWLPFPFMLLGWIVATSRDQALRRRIGMIAAVPLLAALCWSFRNYDAVGSRALSLRAGVNLYPRAIRTTFDDATRRSYWKAAFLGTAFMKHSDPGFDYNDAAGWHRYQEFEAALYAAGKSVAESDRAAADEAKGMVRRHPIRFAVDALPELWKLTSPMTFSGPVFFTFEGLAGTPRFPTTAALLIVARIFQLAFIALMIRGGVSLWRTGLAGQTAAMAVGYHLLLLSLFEALPRYFLPVWPLALFMVLVACYDAWVWKRKRSRDSTRPTATASSTSG